MVVFITIVIGLLGLLGYFVWKKITDLWLRFQVLQYACEDIYGRGALRKRDLIFLSVLWMITLIVVLNPLALLICLLLISLVLKRIINSSSPEVAFKCLRVALALAFLSILMIFGALALVFALFAREDAKKQELRDLFTALRMDRANREIDRIY